MIGQLIRNMLMIYGNYSFIILPITVGALEYVPKRIFKNIQNFGFTKNETKKLIKKLREVSVKALLFVIDESFSSFDNEIF